MPWYSVAIPAFLSLIFAFLWNTVVTTLTKTSISSWFNTQLENHRHQLSKMLEETKFNFTKLANDYSTYNQKRHETYSEIYKLLLQSTGHLSFQASKLVTHMRYDDWTVSGIRENLKSTGFYPDKILDQICILWEQNKMDEAHEQIEHWKARYNFREMEESVRQFRNKYLELELYLSESVAETLKELSKVVSSTEVDAQSHFSAFHDYLRLTPQVVEWRNKSSQDLDNGLKKIEKLIETLKSQMVLELQNGVSTS